MKLYPRKIFICVGILALIPSVISLVIAIKVAALAGTSEGRSFIKVCSTQAPVECTNYSWQQIVCVGLVSILVGAVFLVLGNKKHGNGSGA